MSGAAGPFTELLWAGPSASYAAQAAAVSTAQFLLPGATGAYEQPYIPVNWWQIGRRNQRARIELAGVLNSTGGTATTAIFTVGLTNLANTNTVGGGGGLLTTLSPMTVTSFVANSEWWVTVDLISRMVGYGTTTVSTSLLSDGKCGCCQPATAGGVTGTGPPTLLSTVDAGAQYWVYANVTFSTAVVTNSCQVTRAEVWGLN